MLDSSITLTDNSSGTPTNIVLVEVASAYDANNQKVRTTIGSSSDLYKFITSYSVSKGGVISASYTTQRFVSSGGSTQFCQAKTVFSRPSALVTLSDAHLLSVISAHGRFIDSGSLTTADNIVRLMNGEI